MSEPVPSGGSLERRCPHNGSLRACPNDALEPHSCPYLADVNGDQATLCTCCEACMGECAADV